MIHVSPEIYTPDPLLTSATHTMQLSMGNKTSENNSVTLFTCHKSHG